MPKGNSWRMLTLREGARWPQGDDGRRLLVKANRVAQDLNRTIHIVSGLRTAYEQWIAYQDYLRGGILAAACCWKRYPHTWDDCGKAPTSNHCRSRALDCGVIGKRTGEYHSIGLYKGARASIARHGLLLPLYQPGRWIEPWHMTERRYPG